MSYIAIIPCLPLSQENIYQFMHILYTALCLMQSTKLLQSQPALSTCSFCLCFHLYLPPINPYSLCVSVIAPHTYFIGILALFARLKFPLLHTPFSLFLSSYSFPLLPLHAQSQSLNQMLPTHITQ